MGLTDEIKIVKSILTLYCKTGATIDDIEGKIISMRSIFFSSTQLTIEFFI